MSPHPPLALLAAALTAVVLLVRWRATPRPRHGRPPLRLALPWRRAGTGRPGHPDGPRRGSRPRAAGPSLPDPASGTPTSHRS
ncbi:hypothetical protein [Streptomyces sp. NPDC001388]|uniref:hypothetical protein n=1 Tax=Streptomyces sp. NPDC001388 TaxID=3364568 RepID=UPI0036CD1333